MNNVYLVYGENYSLVKREIEKIINNISDVVYYDLNENNISDLLTDASCISLFDGNKVLVGKNAYFLTTSKSDVNHDIEYLNKYLDDSHDNVVILTVNSNTLDSKKNIVKKLKECTKVIYVEKVDEKSIKDYIISSFEKEGYKIGYKEASLFNEKTGNNVDIINNEIEKTILYKGNDKNISLDDIESVVSKTLSDSVFDLSNAIMDKDYEKIMEYYNDLIKSGMDPIAIINSLSTIFLFIYQCKLLSKEGLNNYSIADKLKAKPGRVMFSLKSKHSEEEIKNVLISLYDLEYDILSGSKDKYNDFEMFLISI